MISERVKRFIGVVVILNIGGLMSVAESDDTTPRSQAILEVDRIEGLSLDLELMGTIIRSDPRRSRALFLTQESQLEESFSIGDDIAEGVVLKKIERDRVQVHRNGQRYWIGINQSTSSELAGEVDGKQGAVIADGGENTAYGGDGIADGGESAATGNAMASGTKEQSRKNRVQVEPIQQGGRAANGINKSVPPGFSNEVKNSQVLAMERTDMEQFYSPEGILMEGAAAKHYGVDLDAGPVQEVLDLDERLALVPDDVKVKDGIPATWWNPRGLNSMNGKASNASDGKTSTGRDAAVGQPE
jgi:hypothetical protein